MSTTRSKILVLGVSLTASSLIATACSSSGGGDTPSSSNTPSTSQSSGAAATTNATASAAAGLRAGLTGLLNDHVWLAGNALQTAVLAKGDLKNAKVKGAVAALDENSVALSKAIGAAYPKAEKPFLDSWRQHIGFFVDYTLGKATKDKAKVAKAEKDLDGYRTSFGQLINSVVPELPAKAVADELKPHVASLFTAIDAAVAGNPKFQALLATAATHMTMTAEVLAGGIAKNKKMTGDPSGTAATVRAVLTAQLHDHVWLAGNALDTAVRAKGNLKDPQVEGAVSALDGNSVALSKTVGSQYPKAEKPFLDSWRQHIGFFVNYTLGKATKDNAKVSMAKDDLNGYAKSFGQLLNSVIKPLPADAVESELKMHVAALLTAIDASVAGETDYQSKLTEAATHMDGTAAAIAAGIATDKKITK